VGDVATQINYPRPKAGVFAVRQGPTLYKNLCRIILKKPLKAHRPQAQFLSLLATGNKHAIASKGGLFLKGDWVWKWKNHIDNKFMNMLKQFPSMKSKHNITVDPVLLDEYTTNLSKHNSTQNSSTEIMRCGGCGAKVSSNVLSSTLKKVTQDIQVITREDVLIGLDSPDDAAVIDTHNQALAQSVDQFRSLIDDPYLFARIATNHSLSDLHAMASTPQSALSIVAMPHASDVILQRELYQLTYGVIEELNKAGCSLTGGHTSEAAELSLGLCVNGLVDKNSIKTKTGIKKDERLIITKPLGTGVIMAAHMQQKADGDDVLSCLNTMLQSNQQAGQIFKRFQCSAMTDITGFGLIGHLLETLKGSDYLCHIDLSKIPLLPGALALSKQGIKSTLFDKNAQAQQYIDNYDQHKKHDAYALLFDPQTSGGLMAWVANEHSTDCIQALKKAGYEAHIIAKLSDDKNLKEALPKIILD
jgi:selenide,water dikinase